MTKRGKVIRAEGVQLPEGSITDTWDSYEYLGIPQASGSQVENTRRSATAKYLQMVRQVLRRQLSGRNKTQVINIYTLPVIRYLAGILSWSQEEMDTADVKT